MAAPLNITITSAKDYPDPPPNFGPAGFKRTAQHSALQYSTQAVPKPFLQK
jgi:hypothetical protein